jgi:tRNA(Ile)-lysidine synthase TilS/MesJ
VKVDLDALVVAFSDDTDERTYYLDRDTGRVFNVLEDHHDDPETQEIVWQLEADTRNQFVQVPKPGIEETIREQDAFVESLDEGDLRSRIDKLLEEDHDGSKFADFVERNREAREAWRDFRVARSREQAREWLKSRGLEGT